MEGYRLLSYLFSSEQKIVDNKTSFKEAIECAAKLIKDGFDKVTIFNKDGSVNRVYYNVNGKPQRLWS